MWKIAVSSLVSGVIAAMIVKSFEEVPQVTETTVGSSKRLEADMQRQAADIASLRQRVDELSQTRLSAARIPNSPSATATVAQVQDIVTKALQERTAEIVASLPVAPLPAVQQRRLVENVQEEIQQEFRERHVLRMKESIAERIFDKIDMQGWQREKMDAIFTVYYANSVSQWDNRAGSSDERRARREESRVERDRQVEAVLDVNQFASYKDLIAESDRRSYGGRDRDRDRERNTSELPQGVESGNPRR